MNKIQKNSFLMLEGVHAYLAEHENIHQNEPGLSEAIGILGTKISEIHDTENQRFNVLIGKVKARKIKRGKLTTLGLAIASKLYAYGKKVNNTELMAQSDYSRSVLNRKRDIELLVVLDTVKANSSQHIESLLQYNITAEKINEFGEEIASFREKIENKISSQSIKTGARKNMQKMFKETRDILRSIDKMMEVYYDSGSQFYLGYKSVRIVKNYGIRHKPLLLQSPLPETDPKAS